MYLVVISILATICCMSVLSHYLSNKKWLARQEASDVNNLQLMNTIQRHCEILSDQIVVGHKWATHWQTRLERCLDVYTTRYKADQEITRAELEQELDNLKHTRENNKIQRQAIGDVSEYDDDVGADDPTIAMSSVAD